MTEPSKPLFDGLPRRLPLFAIPIPFADKDWMLSTLDALGPQILAGVNTRAIVIDKSIADPIPPGPPPCPAGYMRLERCLKGAWVDLPVGPWTKEQIMVYSPTSPTPYRHRTDYNLRLSDEEPAHGNLCRNPSGAISSGETVWIDMPRPAQGDHTADNRNDYLEIE